jgi:hypothetical protein
MLDRAAGAVVVSSALRASAGSVPPALANSVLEVAMSVSTASTATTASYALAKGASKMFMYAKLKLAAGAVAASVIVGGSSVALFARADGDKPAAPAAAAPAAAAPTSNNPAIAKFDDGLTVEIAAIRNLGDDQHWWHADGSASNDACDPIQGSSDPPHTHQALFKLSNAPSDVGVSWMVSPENGWMHNEATLNDARIEGGETISFRAPDQPVAELTCLVAAGPWDSVAIANSLDGTTCTAGKHGGVIFSPVTNAPNPFNNNQPGALVTVSHDVSKYQYRVVATDDSGVEHVARLGNSVAAGTVRQGQYSVDVPVENLRSVTFQVRPYSQRAVFSNVTLDPAKKTTPTVKAERD